IWQKKSKILPGRPFWSGPEQARLPRLISLEALAKAGNDPAGVFVIDLSQDVVRQMNAVDVPKALWRERTLRIWKILVVGLQKPPIEPHSLFGPRTVGSEQNAILILLDESPRRSRLAA